MAPVIKPDTKVALRNLSYLFSIKIIMDKKPSHNRRVRETKMLCHQLRVIGYQKFVGIESFLKPNFILMADILYFLCSKVDQKSGINTSINDQNERIQFIKGTLSFLESKTGIQIDPYILYQADSGCVLELIRLTSLFYNGLIEQGSSQLKKEDFQVPIRFDRRKSKDLCKRIQGNGQTLYQSLSQYDSIEFRMDQSIATLEDVLKEYNVSTVAVDNYV